MKFILNFYAYVAYWMHRIIVAINPKIEINRCFKKVFGRKANLKSPKSLIEKIYWMQLFCDTSEWSVLADKYKMRSYVKEKKLDKYLPKLYAKWNNPDLIRFDNLPKSFVLKVNNGCGNIIIVNDKNTVILEDIIKQIKKTFNIPFGYSGYEPHYLKIEPCIIAEELLIQNKELSLISQESMIDFKFWCFNGHVESCLVTYGRSKGNLFIDLYDCTWNRQINYLKEFKIERINNNIEIPKPQCLNQMISIASKLSEGHPEMRVDMYIVDDKPVIGELTMSSGYGYFTDEYYNYLGSLVDTTLLFKNK